MEELRIVKGDDPRFEATMAGVHLPAVAGDQAFGGGIEGADKLSRETASWNPSYASPDQAINPIKPEADARSLDMTTNDGLSAGAVTVHKDSVVGAHFRLVARPNYRLIGADADWALEFINEAESRFNIAAESESNWFDAKRELTLTGMLRLAIGVFVYTGEHLSTVEWIQESDRPFNTAIQMIDSARLSNPNGAADTQTLRRGVQKDFRGKPISYWIQDGHPSEWYDMSSLTWTNVPAETKWGRKQVLFIKEADRIDQTRGIAAMVAALKHIRMTKKFSEITLQNAVINASYAAAVESELPSAELVASLGGGVDGFKGAIGSYMDMLNGYLKGANVAIDGAKIPHFFPGTSLNLKPMGTPGGIGTDFEASLMRRVCAVLGVSYPEFSRDFSKVSYSAARAEMATTGRTMQSRKRLLADRIASNIYALWVEEQMAAGNLPLPPRRNRTDFYRPLMKDAYTRCMWIGTGRGQIDEMKETQAAIMRINAGLSDWGVECARLGLDYREVAENQATQRALFEKLGLTYYMNTKVANSGSQQQADPNNEDTGTTDENDKAQSEATQDA